MPRQNEGDKGVNILKIDKVYFICMNPKNDRYWAQIGALGAMGVPHDRVECFQGVNGKDEKFKTFKDWGRAIVDDGFPQWECYTEKEDWGQYGGPQSLAIEWTHLKLARQIAERGENAIVLEDDTILTRNFFEIERRFSQLPEVKCVFLWWTFFHGDDPHYPRDEIFKQETQYTGVSEIFTGYVPAGQRAKFYTAAGAKEYLNMRAAFSYLSGEATLWEKNVNKDFNGYYLCFPTWAIDFVERLDTVSYKL